MTRSASCLLGSRLNAVAAQCAVTQTQFFGRFHDYLFQCPGLSERSLWALCGAEIQMVMMKTKTVFQMMLLVWKDRASQVSIFLILPIFLTVEQDQCNVEPVAGLQS